MRVKDLARNVIPDRTFRQLGSNLIPSEKGWRGRLRPLLWITPVARTPEILSRTKHCLVSMLSGCSEQRDQSKEASAMRHTTIGEIGRRAAVVPVPMTTHERLVRWAEVLEQNPNRLLRPFEQLEYVRDRRLRDAQRIETSPLTVAFEDPVLRGEGLKSDRIGDAIEFFDLSDNTLHYILCHCYLAAEVTAGTVASRIRRLTTKIRPPRALNPRYVIASMGVLSILLLGAVLI